MAKKQQPPQPVNLLGEPVETPPPEETKEEKDPKRPVYRWTEGNAEWGTDADGHHRIVRCGDLAPGGRARGWVEGRGYRVGTIQTLVPGGGPAPKPVIVYMILDPTPGRRQPDKPVPVRFLADDVIPLRKQVKTS